jgi:hypothetical protein
MFCVCPFYLEPSISSSQGLIGFSKFSCFQALLFEPQISGQGFCQIEVEQQTIKDHQTASYLSPHSFLLFFSYSNPLSPFHENQKSPQTKTKSDSLKNIAKKPQVWVSPTQKKQHFHFPLMMLMGFSCETRLRDVKNGEEKTVQGFLIDVIFAAIKRFRP